MNNLISLVWQQAHRFPHKQAMVLPDYSRQKRYVLQEAITFGGLARKIQTYAATLESQKFAPGDRLIILLPISADLYALVLAAMAAGVVPVLINPGLDKKAFFHSIRQVKAKGIIADHLLLLVSAVLPALKEIPHTYSLNSTFWGIQNFNVLALALNETTFQIKQVPQDHPALITFTSGSSGLPKGVTRTHGNLLHQHLALKEEFPPQPEQIDFPAFPVLTLHNLCCGHTTIMPLVRFKDVSQVKVPLLLQQILTYKVTTLAGAPAYLQKIADYCLQQEITLPAITGLAVGGAPVETDFCRQLMQVFPNADAYIVYGSSEAEPIASISFTEYLQTESKRYLGYCVGKQASAVRVTFLPLSSLKAQELQQQDVSLKQEERYGEIAVSGEHVCKQYFENPEADSRYKFTDEQGNHWHKTGDIGFKDENEQLWLVGRQENGFIINNQLYFPYPFERVVNNLRGVHRSAVVACHTQLVVCLEGAKAKPSLEEQIRHAIKDFFDIPHITILYITKLPVDRRHQSKINYLLLQQWVYKQLNHD